MKKSISLLLAVTLCVTITGCANQTAPTASDSTTSSSSSSNDASQTISSAPILPDITTSPSSSSNDTSQTSSSPSDTPTFPNEKVEEFISEIYMSGRGGAYVGSTSHFEKMFVDFDGTKVYLPIQNTDFLYQHPYAYSLVNDSLCFARFSENSPDLISIFLTTDKGKSWQQSELNVENANNYYYYISFQSSGKGFLALKSRENGSDHIIYTSEDFGKSWNPASFIPNSYVTWIRNIRTAGDYFWIAGQKISYPVILKSNDGINWKEVQLSLDTTEYPNGSCTNVYFSDEIGLAVLIGETGDEKKAQHMWYLSKDSGETWSFYKFDSSAY